MRNFVISIISLFTIIFAILGIGRVKDEGNFTQNRWLSELPDDKYISEISLPGTHDTCALYEPWYGVVKCQTYSLRDQLDMGVRFLDIRGRLNFSKINIYHGITYQCIDLDSVVEICTDFLEENPTETIIMSIKIDGDSSDKFIPLVDRTIEKNSDLWYIENRLPTLGDVRGKIVLFNRYSPVEKGLYAFNFNSSPHTVIENPGYNIHIQDNYSVSENEIKWQNITDMYNESRANSDGENLYVNFTSGNNSTKENIAEFKDYINPLLEEYLFTAEKGCYGIVVMDYVTSELCDRVIQTNF